MKKINNILTICLSIIVVFLLLGCSSCTTANGKPHSKPKVEVYAKTHIDEKVKLINSETIQDKPKVISYYYKTINRDDNFEFEIHSGIYREDSLSFYHKEINTNYAMAIKSYYFKKSYNFIKNFKYVDLKDIKKDYFDERYATNYNLYICCDIKDYNELQEVIEFAYELNDIYSDELDYNSIEFLEEHPFLYLTIRFNEGYYGESEYPFHQIINLPINGVMPDDTVRAKIENEYVRLIESEKLPYDDNVPDTLYEKINDAIIKNVYINGTLLEDSMANYKTPTYTTEPYNERKKYYNDRADAFALKYSDADDNYYILLNVGLADDEANPHNFEAIAELICDDYEVKYNKGELYWSIDKDDYSLISKETNDKISSVTLNKNGKNIPIDYYANSNPTFYVNTSYLIAIDIDTFATMFDLDYEIDYDKNAIYFESN